MANGNSTENISISLPSWIIELMDAHLASQPIPQSRSQFVTEAILDHVLLSKGRTDQRFIQLIKAEYLGSVRK